MLVLPTYSSGIRFPYSLKKSNAIITQPMTIKKEFSLSSRRVKILHSTQASKSYSSDSDYNSSGVQTRNRMKELTPFGITTGLIRRIMAVRILGRPLMSQLFGVGDVKDDSKFLSHLIDSPDPGVCQATCRLKLLNLRNLL